MISWKLRQEFIANLIEKFVNTFRTGYPFTRVLHSFGYLRFRCFSTLSKLHVSKVCQIRKLNVVSSRLCNIAQCCRNDASTWAKHECEPTEIWLCVLKLLIGSVNSSFEMLQSFAMHCFHRVLSRSRWSRRFLVYGVLAGQLWLESLELTSQNIIKMKWKNRCNNKTIGIIKMIR